MEDSSEKAAKNILRFGVVLMSLLAESKKSFNSNGKSRLPISESRFRILLTMKHLNIHTIVEIHEITGVSESTLSILMSKLAGEGYLRKERPKESEDGRKKYFSLTVQGEEALRRACQMTLDHLALIHDRLSSEKQVYLYQGVHKLLNVFDSLIGTVNDLEAEQ